jgi:hypothetical protein
VDENRVSVWSKQVGVERAYPASRRTPAGGCDETACFLAKEMISVHGLRSQVLTRKSQHRPCILVNLNRSLDFVHRNYSF